MIFWLIESLCIFLIFFPIFLSDFSIATSITKSRLGNFPIQNTQFGTFKSQQMHFPANACILVNSTFIYFYLFRFFCVNLIAQIFTYLLAVAARLQFIDWLHVFQICLCAVWLSG